MGLSSSINRTRKIGSEFEGFIILTGSGDARSAQESLARAWLHLHMAMLDHAARRSCQAAPAPLVADRKSFDSLMVTIGMKSNSRVYKFVDPTLRASAIVGGVPC